MSQHYVKNKSYIVPDGIDVEVYIGWDEPTGGFYMYVQCEDEHYADEEGLLYGNLYDVGTTMNLIYFVNKLIELKIAVDPDMFLAAVADFENAAVNQEQDWQEIKASRAFDFTKHYASLSVTLKQMKLDKG